ncbi:MAG: DnaJ domain-containing protein [Cyclobacteriaceae bacterium]|nr:DnaJ domain-containing protein [Cyclobacteriaceae bacterium]
MKDYYAILHVSKVASYEEIRKSYKKLAVTFHPDKNPGNSFAEEQFKLINEAYQVLSDEGKRNTYDFMVYHKAADKYHQKKPTGDTPVNSQRSSAKKNPYQNRPPQPKRSYYIIDKEYYRVQKIILIIFFTMLGMAYLLNLGKHYVIELREKAELEAIRMSLDSVYGEFEATNYSLSLNILSALLDRNILNRDIYQTKDSLVFELRKKAVTSFREENYDQSATLLGIVVNYELPMEESTLQMLSESYIKSGKNEKAVQLLKALLREKPDNMELMIRLSKILFEEQGNVAEASFHLDRVKDLYRQLQIRIYGKAFELVMVPETTPEIYYELFYLRAQVNMSLNDFEEAYTDCNWAIFLRPERPDAYLWRIESGIQTGMLSRVCNDLKRAQELDQEVDRTVVKRYCHNS